MKEAVYTQEAKKMDGYVGECPILYALELVGKKWKIPILWHLFEEEKLHYNELKKKIDGITNTMLTKSLRELAINKLIIRYSYDTISPSVEYRLSERGKTLIPALNELCHWGDQQMKLDK
jgi:DNA-binding HxlR family transcriptional regulator